ncbi:hypothetical protein [Pedobacter panaciterrae]
MNIKSLPMILGLLTFLGFCCLTLVVLPAFSEQFNFSTSQTSNIGSTIGGVMGPLVGIFSAYLLYEALTAQQEGNKDQRIKADSDIIFLLFNQLDQEYNTFTTESTIEKTGKDPVVKNYHGYAALLRFCQMYGNHNRITFNAFLNDSRSDDLLLLLRSFDLIIESIHLADFSERVNVIFYKKTFIYYKSKLEHPLNELSKLLINEDHPIAKEILEFKSRNLSRMDSNYQ